MTVQIFSCERLADRPRCSVDGCGRPAEASCEFALTGPASGRACGRKLCAGHATMRLRGEPRGVLCGPHERMASKRAGTT